MSRHRQLKMGSGICENYSTRTLFNGGPDAIGKSFVEGILHRSTFGSEEVGVT
jgi:hypothetical protein